MVRPALRSVARLSAVATFALACMPEEPLEQRAAKYWKARQERDAATAYPYEHPETRGTEGEYVAKIATGPLAISAAEVEKVEVDGDDAKVTVRMTYRHALMPRDVKAPIVDLWTKVDGRWYHKPPSAEFIAGSGMDDALRRRAPVATPGAKP
jgi:hypothetical protein